MKGINAAVKIAATAAAGVMLTACGTEFTPNRNRNASLYASPDYTKVECENCGKWTKYYDGEEIPENCQECEELLKGEDETETDEDKRVRE